MVLLNTVIIFNTCKKDDIAPQLQITAFDSDSKVVDNAEVTLYISENNWINQQNSVTSGYTDSEGKVKFTELEEKVYYFRAEKDSINNDFTECYLENTLKKNQLTKITITLN